MSVGNRTDPVDFYVGMSPMSTDARGHSGRLGLDHGARFVGMVENDGSSRSSGPGSSPSRPPPGGAIVFVKMDPMLCCDWVDPFIEKVDVHFGHVEASPTKLCGPRQKGFEILLSPGKVRSIKQLIESLPLFISQPLFVLFSSTVYVKPILFQC